MYEYVETVPTVQAQKTFYRTVLLHLILAVANSMRNQTQEKSICLIVFKYFE